MVIFLTPVVLIALIAFSAMHWLSVYREGVISKISVYVNIALHILVMIPMLAAKFTIEEAVLVYMISVFIYTFMAFIRAKLDIKNASAQQLTTETEDAKEESGGAV